ncbi:Hypothetical predicted protein, partial [Mytilus galloprovincialis]
SRCWNFFYDGDALKDVGAETVDELCQHLKKQSVCKKADKCKVMDFVTEMMADIERAVCVEFKKDYNPNTCGFVDGLKNCASMFQQCGDKQHASAVANMISEY